MSISGKHFYRFTYLRSEEWAAVRKMALAKNGAACKLCGKVDWYNDAHHLFYRDNIWDTKYLDLIVLCRSCHIRLHDRLGKFASVGLNWRRIKRRSNANPISAGVTQYDKIKEKRFERDFGFEIALKSVLGIYLLTLSLSGGKRVPSTSWWISALLGWQNKQPGSAGKNMRPSS